jgi:hypothetical protein
MNFKEYIEKAWNDHATDAKLVFESFQNAEKLITSRDEITQLVRLITHVCGDHLGLWREGILKLQNLTQNQYYQPNTESELSIKRSIAMLKLCADDSTSIIEFSPSDKIRILAMAAGSIFEHGDFKRAKKFFTEALELAVTGLSKDDPANRAVAITGNNLACSIEEKANRTEDDIQLMILASKTGRKYWEIAGGKSEVAMAEYRLSQTYLQAKMIELSYEHAQNCVELCEENQLSSLDHFYGYEALALAEKLRQNELGFLKALEKVKIHFEQLSPEDKKWCEKTLSQLI